MGFAARVRMFTLPTNAKPYALRLDATSVCQLACPSCPTATGETFKFLNKGHLSPEKFEKLLKDNPGRIEQIELSNYGEAFLNPKLLEIFKIAFHHGVALTIHNGANLNNAKDEVLEGLVQYNVRGITCSIDGASQETYEVYRRRGNFDTVIANIKKINEYKKKYQSAYPRLCWQFVVFGHNEHEIQKAREMAEELDMVFKPKLSWDSEFSPIKNIVKVKRDTGFKAESREKIHEQSGEIVLSNICHQLWDQPQFNYDGRVLGCCANHWGEFGGNMFDNLEGAINSEKMIYARSMLMGKAPARDDIPCTQCETYKKRQQSQSWVHRPEPKQMAKVAGDRLLVHHDNFRVKLARKGWLKTRVLNPSRV